MPQLRRDPIIGRWVIISTERAKRPIEWGKREPSSQISPEYCPFCPGNERFAPHEIFVIGPPGRQPDSPGWEVRVVPNKFPALIVEGELNKRGVGLYDMMNGIGAHEVIIETPDHYLRMSQMTQDNIKKILIAYKERLADLKKDIRFKYIMIFKNYGEEAGASLSHSHSQLIALPVVPKRVKEEMDGAKKYYEYRDRCVYCDIIAQELHSQERVIIDERNFIVIAPFASCSPFETWIIPKKHCSDFLKITDDELNSLALVLGKILRKLDICLMNPSFNYIIHTSSFDNSDNPFYHWHIEIMPKLTKIAGFEWGTGFYINPTPPEEAAEYLKGVD